MDQVETASAGKALLCRISQLALGLRGKPDANRDEASGVTVAGELVVGGVPFFASDASGKVEVYAFNPNIDNYAIIRTGKVVYCVAPTQKVPFAEACEPELSPLTEVEACILRGGFDVVGFSGLKRAKPVTSGVYEISCDNGRLSISSQQLAPGDILSPSLSSDNGVSWWSSCSLSPLPELGGDSGAGHERRYDLVFEALGFDMNHDTLAGSFFIRSDSPSYCRGTLVGAPSEPLHPAEALFLGLGAEGKG